MRKYLPHISYFSLLIILLMVGFGSRVLAIVAFAGAVAGVATDPLLVIGAIMIGASCIKQRYLVFSSLLFAIIISILIARMNSDLGASLTLYIIFARLIAILTIAYLVNAFRINVFKSMPEEKPSHTPDKSFPPIPEIESAHTLDKSSKSSHTETLCAKIEKQFISLKQWRLFLVIQVVGLVFAVFIDATSRLDLFPEWPNRLRYLFRLNYWDWDLVHLKNYRHWAPWFFLLSIFGPFVSIKAYNWILSPRTDKKNK